MPDKSYVGMSVCFFCMQPKEVLLNVTLRDTLPREAIYDLEPCCECKEHMVRGIIIISYDEERTDFDNTIELPCKEGRKVVWHDTGIPNFYRAGLFAVVDPSCVERLAEDFEPGSVTRTALDESLRRRVLFLPQKVCDFMGLTAAVRDMQNSKN